MMFVVKIPSVFSKLFLGIALWPFVLVTNLNLKKDKVLINHEQIHLRQQLELLVVPFYIWYVFEFLFRLVQYKNKHLAYKNICFEREAYTMQNQLAYLKSRPFWNFLNYLK